MKINQESAGRCALFHGIGPEELGQVLDCLDAVQKSVAAGEAVFWAGERADRIGVLLSGKAQVIREEYDGTRTIVTELKPGELFGETFACAARDEGKTFPVTVLSAAESVVLLLNYQRAVSTCPAACPFHGRLIENMLAILAEKNLLLNRRLGHLSKRGTREKLLSYLRETAASQGGTECTVPFNRQELADYLCVERSAMSAALSRLQREGLIQYHKNNFTIIHPFPPKE